MPPDVEMSIPGLDWGVDEVMGKETKKVPQKKVPYAKPIPAQFQQVAEDHQELVQTRALAPSSLSCMNVHNHPAVRNLLCAGLGGEQGPHDAPWWRPG